MRFALALSVLLIVAAATSNATARPPQHKQTRTTSFIAQHTNTVLEKKCLRPFRSPATRAVWIQRHRAAHRRKPGTCTPATPWYVSKQIWAGNILGREAKEAGARSPWPNCPDPWDGGGHSWQDTVNCENNGNWLDSPGPYRCGLQFAPSWERRFGRLCP
jgi:hypothetical protein